MTCPSCGADLPKDAHFCIECGVAVRPAATDATIKLPARAEALACRACGAANPPDAIFCVRCGRRHGAPVYGRIDAPAPLAPPPALPRRMRAGRRAGPLLPAIALIGLGLPLLVGKVFFWQGALILLGAILFMHEASHGRTRAGLSVLTLALGLILALSMARLFLPIVLITGAALLLINLVRRP